MMDDLLSTVLSAAAVVVSFPLALVVARMCLKGLFRAIPASRARQ
jgi:hypothetical protein